MEIRTPAAGILARTPAAASALVRAGDVVAEIHPVRFEAALELDRAKAAAQAEVEVARADSMIAQIDLAFTRIPTPDRRSGRALRPPPGTHLGGPKDRIVRVLATDRILVRFELDEAARAAVRRAGNPDGVRVAIGFEGEDGFHSTGRLDAVAPESDAKTGGRRCRVVVPNTGDRINPPGRPPGSGT